MADRATILVVEDDAASAEMLIEMFGLADYDVESTATVDGAVDAMERRRYGAALLDLTLASAPMAELLERLLRLPERPPIVIFSARTTDDLRLAAERLSAAAVLQKPANMDTLLSTMARVVRRPPE